jgi:transaldolase/glucose-6-phosphate isomerase
MNDQQSAKSGAAGDGVGFAADAMDQLCIDTIRTLSMDAVQKANSGHPGTPMALAPVAYTLWQGFLRYDPRAPDWPNRDRFVLSNGHASMLLYSLLHLADVRDKAGGQAVTLDDIKAFRQIDSRCPGHPEHGLTTGVEVTTGPLGQGCGASVGMAMAGRWLAQSFNRPDFELFDYDVYAFCSDGDMMEGVASEAASLAGHLMLGNLCWIYDNNRITIEGHTDLGFSDNMAARFLAYGWNVEHVGDANDTGRMAEALGAFRRAKTVPTLIIVDSHIGYGAPHKQDTASAHGEALGVEEVRLAKRAYGWPEDAHFFVPEGVRERFQARLGRRGAERHADWSAVWRGYREKHPDLAARLERMWERKAPDGWDADLPDFPADAKGLATRASGAKAINAIARNYPWMLGGSADLSPSTNTNLTFDGAGAFGPGKFGGRNLHFGIREHAMGAVLNGLAVSGIRAYGSTFLVFSDYMKPPMRLAALMGLPVIFVFTHDSIGLGEDGPTHQPVEQLLSMRGVPGLITLRPADANEVAEAWRVAGGLTDRPVSLVLTRQALPTFDRQVYAPAAGLAKGAYVMADAKPGVPEVILIGTGSEVQLCAQAYESLKQEGVAARLVSMPSWELFEAQDQAYRDSVLPPAVRARVTVEAGSVVGWDRYAGATGAMIGMHGFGASAPLKDVMAKFGFTADHVIAAARRQLGKDQRRGQAERNPLKRLADCGQAPWLDFLTRSLVQGGGLKALIERDGLMGVTSNPSIFEKAIGESDDYAGAIKALLAERDRSITEIYEDLAIADIQAACDVMRVVHDQTQGRDGFVSLECSPYLANDTEATVAEAVHLWETVGRPNLMVKVPATPAGIPAIRRLIGRGVNVNITLLFAVEVYEQVAEAYIGGLEDLRRACGDPSRLASVASFFVSRIDSAVDKALGALGDAGAALQGKVAIANAKVAYDRYKSLFSGARWDALASAGARTQRLLWASTSTKNPDYRDTLYVEAMIGRDTVDTIPPSTMDAFREHGVVRSDAIEEDLDGARATLAALGDLGISLSDITARLVEEGVQQFADAFDKLFGAIAVHRREYLGDSRPALQIEPGSEDAQAAFAAEMELWRKEGRIRKLWAGDKSLWTGHDEDKWTGWLEVVEAERDAIGRLKGFADQVKTRGFTDVVLLGMGGSSLGPEVLGETFGDQTGWPRFHMLDSTDPAQIKDIEERIDLARTLFIVSSKSGGTLEPNIFADYFMARIAAICGKDQVGERFVAVTDPGSSLDKRAREAGFAHTFYGEPSIGGRYSVLSKFGLAPAAAMGLDIERLLMRTQAMERACGPDVPPQENPGVQLGVALGVAATRLGRDKVTIIASPGIADIGAWLEQLLAESTGKQGKGLIPVAGEPAAPPDSYGADRFFAYLELEGGADPAQREAVSALAAAGHPVARISVPDAWSIGPEFFRWEIAVAVAGSIIGIDPFDQPDVESSKENTRALTDQYEVSQTLPKEEPLFHENGVALYADPRNAQALGRHDSLGGYLKSHFDRLQPGDYASVLAYVDRTDAHTDAMTRMRTLIRDRKRVATCVGFGPRFQHSTGQAYKGGPNTGVFLQITCNDPVDIDVPGHRYSFGVVKAAQARGDLDALVGRGRRALRVHLNSVEADLPELVRAVHEAVA